MPTPGCRRPATGGHRGIARRLAGLAGITVALVATVLAGCGTARPITPPLPPVTPAPEPGESAGAGAGLRYVALGDSYTIGTSVTEAERFPNQLVDRIPLLELVANLGVNGFTTHDLIEVELPKLPALDADVVTVLIGVNDVVQGLSTSTYKDNVIRILDALVEEVGANRILVVTIPDYTVTPQGGAFGDPRQQSQGIQERNLILTSLAGARGIQVVDIYDISLEAATDRTLVASDGLHPSGAQYGRWVDRIVLAMEMLVAH